MVFTATVVALHKFLVHLFCYGKFCVIVLQT